MVVVKKVERDNRKYFYLVHSFRKGSYVKNKQTYLGKTIPVDIEKRKEEFMKEHYREIFLDDLNKIHNNFEKEYNALPASAKEKFQDIFAVRFTYNTQKIEGSTLSLKDTSKLLEDRITPSSKPIKDIREAEAHKQVFDEMMEYKGDLNLKIVLEWNRRLLEQTKPDLAGRIREHQVAISRSEFIPPLAIEVEFLLREFFEWYDKNKKKLHPVELAALVHLKFVTIHPFGDGNGRISRLMMNFVLRKNKFPLFDITYAQRSSYYSALERSQVKKEDNIFIRWFFRRYIAEHKKYLKK